MNRTMRLYEPCEAKSLPVSKIKQRKKIEKRLNIKGFESVTFQIKRKNWIVKSKAEMAIKINTYFRIDSGYFSKQTNCGSWHPFSVMQ